MGIKYHLPVPQHVFHFTPVQNSGQSLFFLQIQAILCELGKKKPGIFRKIGNNPPSHRPAHPERMKILQNLGNVLSGFGPTLGISQIICPRGPLPTGKRENGDDSVIMHHGLTEEQSGRDEWNGRTSREG